MSPDVEIGMTIHINVADRTFRVQLPIVPAPIEGKLEGAPWQWTGYSATFHVDGGEGSIRSVSSATQIMMHFEIHSARQTITTDSLSTEFDCGELAKRRAAMKPVSGG